MGGGGSVGNSKINSHTLCNFKNVIYLQCLSEKIVNQQDFLKKEVYDHYHDVKSAST